MKIKRRMPGMVSTSLAEKPAARRMRCITIAATTDVINVVPIRNASR